MSLELPFGIKPVVPLANVDERYGPYQSVEDALIGTEGTRVIGLTVGVIDYGVLVEYWFEDGILDHNLIQKKPIQEETQEQQAIHYITLNNYSPAEDIEPEVNEVRIGDVIWRTSNEDWTDGGVGIYSPNGDDLNVPDFGRLYTYDAIPRLLAANPGYRIPTAADWNSLRDYLRTLSQSTYKYNLDGDKVVDPNPIYWNQSGVVASNELQLSLIPAGFRNNISTFQSFKDLGYWWQDQGESQTFRYLENVLYYGNLAVLSIQKPTAIGGVYNSTIACSIRLVKDI